MATPKTPRTPLETLLDDTARDRLTHHIDRRVESIESQLLTFWEKRKKYRAQMMDDFEWRRGERSTTTTKDGWFSQNSLDEWSESIFDYQNDSLNIVGGFAAFMTARATDDALGSYPIMAMYPEGKADKVLTESIQKHSDFKIRRSPWLDAAGDAIDLAIGLGEAVIKQAWDKEVDIYETRAVVLYDGATKQAVKTSTGDYFYEGDANQIGTMQLPNGTTTAALVFEKDPLTPIPVASVSWQDMEIEKTNVTYDNIRAATIKSEDFLCAENEADIHESDFVAHRLQRRLSYLKARYKLDEDTVAQLSQDTYDPKTEEAKPDDVLQENQESFAEHEKPDPWIEILECWMKLDPVGDGRMRRIRVVYAKKAEIILTMDYTANVTPKGELPFHVVRAFRVKGRWWGRGYYEIYEKAQEFIDRHLNYVAYRNRFHSNPVVFYDDSVLFEDEESQDFELRPGASYRLKAGYKKEDCVQTLELPDLDDRTWQLLDLMIQIIQTRSGVTGAAQGQTGDLPTSATATGVNAIIQNGSVLAKMPMNEMKRGLEKSLGYTIKLIHANMNPVEVFTYFEGDEEKIGTLMAQSVEGLDMNVRMTMTRFNQREAIESAKEGILMMKDYVALPEGEKMSQRPMFVQAIQGLRFDDADSIVRQPIAQIDPLTGQPMAPQPLPAPEAEANQPQEQPQLQPA